MGESRQVGVGAAVRDVPRRGAAGRAVAVLDDVDDRLCRVRRFDHQERVEEIDDVGRVA